MLLAIGTVLQKRTNSFSRKFLIELKRKIDTDNRKQQHDLKEDKKAMTKAKQAETKIKNTKKWTRRSVIDSGKGPATAGGEMVCDIFTTPFVIHTLSDLLLKNSLNLNLYVSSQQC